MQPIRTEKDEADRNETFSERKEKENLSLPIALWRSCFYLCTIKFSNNQLQMKKRYLSDRQRFEISAYPQSEKTQKEISRLSEAIRAPSLVRYNAMPIVKMGCISRNWPIENTKVK